jgi:hypothetical protein
MHSVGLALPRCPSTRRDDGKPCAESERPRILEFSRRRFLVGSWTASAPTNASNGSRKVVARDDWSLAVVPIYLSFSIIYALPLRPRAIRSVVESVLAGGEPSNIPREATLPIKLLRQLVCKSHRSCAGCCDPVKVARGRSDMNPETLLIRLGFLREGTFQQ